jgi:hypothetical protein
MKIEYPMKLTFTLEEQNNILTKAFVVEDDVQWMDLVIKFADFLNAQYGYEVKEKIAFVSDWCAHDWYTVIGERTISSEAFEIAKAYDQGEFENPLNTGEPTQTEMDLSE